MHLDSQTLSFPFLHSPPLSLWNASNSDLYAHVMKMFGAVRAALYEATGTAVKETHSSGGFRPGWVTGPSQETPWPGLEPEPFSL